MEYFSLAFWQGAGSSLLVVIVVALMTPVKSRIIVYKNRQRFKKLKQELRILEYEKEHLEKIKRSGISLSRVIYSDIFWLLLYLSIGLGIPILGPVAANTIIFSKPIVQFLLPLAIPVWAVSIIIAIHNINKLNNLNNYAKTIEELDSKIQKIQQKIDGLPSK
ncbi:MAG TPA: hypothetical protein PLP22_01430 [Candidatus Competibacter sp.]|nr:hypothetical protein [Candidatus Competibacter sp.]HUM94416.1 hypothetical protein [Candidatus Competibacter sp.]